MTETSTNTDSRPIVSINDKEYRVNLSQEQADKIAFHGIYKADPEDFRDFSHISQYWDTSGKYHCRNWCFRVEISLSGEVYFVDTYWNSSSDTYFEITEDNFDDMIRRFKLVMDNKENYRKISLDNATTYDPEEIVEVAFGSGGWTYSSGFWVHKDATPSSKLVLKKSLREAESELSKCTNTSSLRYALSVLEKDIEKTLQEEGSLDDAEDLKERDEFFSSLDSEKMCLGDAAEKDFSRWLTENAYCPGEIYDRGGFFYRIFDEKDVVYKFFEGDTSERKNEFFFSPDKDCIVVVVSKKEDGKTLATDSIFFDATKHNFEYCLSCGEEKIDVSKLDEYPAWHDNGSAPLVVEKLKVALSALEDLSSVLDRMGEIQESEKN